MTEEKVNENNVTDSESEAIREYRYVVNIIYQKPYEKEERMLMELVGSSLGFDKKKDAKKLFDNINRTGMIIFGTSNGEISFQVISCQLIDTTLVSN